jgi:glutaredoxin
MSEPRIVFFATASCPYCAAARDALRACGEPFIERDPTCDTEALRALLVVASTPTVPAITVGGRALVGFDRERLEELLHEPALDEEPDEDAGIQELLGDDEEV